MGEQRTKALPEDENEALRERLRVIIRDKFKGNATGAAAAMGVSQSLVSDFLGRNRGAGTKLLRGIAKVSGDSLDDLLGHVPAADVGAADMMPAGDDTIPGTILVLDPRYPNLTYACGVMRGEGCPEEVLREVSGIAHESPSDQPFDVWRVKIKMTWDAFKLRAKDPITFDAAELEKAERDAKIADERAELARPRVPKKKAK